VTGDALQSNGDTPQLSDGTAGSFLGEDWGYGMDRADCFAFSPLGMMHREMYVSSAIRHYAIFKTTFRSTYHNDSGNLSTLLAVSVSSKAFCSGF